MPKTLFAQAVVAKPITTIPLSDRGPFRFEDIQGYSFPRLTNDDESSLYFYPYYGSGGNKEPSYEVFRYDKKTKAVKTDRVTDFRTYRREKVFGFYRNLRSHNDGIMRIDTERSWVYSAEGRDPDVYYISEPQGS